MLSNSSRRIWRPETSRTHLSKAANLPQGPAPALIFGLGSAQSRGRRKRRSRHYPVCRQCRAHLRSRPRASSVRSHTDCSTVTASSVRPQIACGSRFQTWQDRRARSPGSAPPSWRIGLYGFNRELSPKAKRMHCRQTKRIELLENGCNIYLADTISHSASDFDWWHARS
jgi:hypothetical protein